MKSPTIIPEPVLKTAALQPLQPPLTQQTSLTVQNRSLGSVFIVFKSQRSQTKGPLKTKGVALIQQSRVIRGYGL